MENRGDKLTLYSKNQSHSNNKIVEIFETRHITLRGILANVSTKNKSFNQEIIRSKSQLKNRKIQNYDETDQLSHSWGNCIQQ
jgi:hypothetical protein